VQLKSELYGAIYHPPRWQVIGGLATSADCKLQWLRLTAAVDESLALGTALLLAHSL
jgi:hypothetical protein